MKTLFTNRWQYANRYAGWTGNHVARFWRRESGEQHRTPKQMGGTMRKQFVTVALLVGVMGAISVMAEEPAINPIRVTTRQINAYGTNPIQIMGTNVTATAAELSIMDGVTVSASQINAAGGGTTATIAPTTANITTANITTGTASTLFTISKTMVKTAATLSATKGALLLTVTNDLVLFTNHYGVVTCSVAAATSPGQELEIWNLVGTNIVFDESTGLNLPAGYTAWTNGIGDMIKFRAVGTNWQCSGYSDL